MSREILIVDDEADIRSLVAGIMEDEGYRTREAANSMEALDAVEQGIPSLVLLDIWLRGSKLDGIGILREMRKRRPDLPIVMMSGHGTVETAARAIRLGAYDFIEKPFKVDRLVVVAERAIETSVLKRENLEFRQKERRDTVMIGRSGAINALRAAIDRVAPTNSRVLITGPSGSGKEVAARRIHAQSNRAAGPFVVVNCATMDPGRVELELFGAEPSGDDGEGAKVGMFEQAHNGTLFLDEVADMPLETQGKIVRVLQEQVFQRIGGSKMVQVDVRVVASATKDIGREMAEGNFREDLYFRLNVVPIEIPPLIDRRDDIPDLALVLMETAAQACGQPPRKLGLDAIADLRTYHWPGNVRELRNVIERLLIMAPGGPGQIITSAHLPKEITDGLRDGAVNRNNAEEFMGLPLKEARENFERDYLSAQIARFDGNISKTAGFVGMERSALHRKIRALGLQGDAKSAKAD